MLDLVAIAAPLEPIRFPNGREFAARPLDAAGWELAREVQRTQDPEQALALLKRCVPDATDEDLASLGNADGLVIVKYCARQVDLAMEALGNSRGAMTESTSPPSPPNSTPSTS